jgi:8-oxo-dGTP pyrophosphatase MutT (NUDIX family)
MMYCVQKGNVIVEGIMPVNDIQQVGAIPLIRDHEGQLCIVLVTTRGSGRWTIPKGNIMAKLDDHKAAEREAREEAGLVGKITKKPLGTYQFWKRQDAHWSLAEVTVFVLQVEGQLDQFKEKGQRDIKAFRPEDAVDAVYEAGLGALIRQAVEIVTASQTVPARDD